MNPASALEQHAPPIAAILRGVKPDEVIGIGAALAAAGISIIEVPLNSPEALKSIERLAAGVGARVLVGAGTVLTPASVDDVAAAGARFAVSPNTDPAVIARSLERGLEPMPGIMTPTEALRAVAEGARHLKLFPAASIGSSHVRALLDVLPDDCRVWAVGGVGTSNLHRWIAAGAFGVGIGGSLYRPGCGAAEVRGGAEELVDAFRRLTRTRE